jgi:hypothetical protein
MNAFDGLAQPRRFASDEPHGNVNPSNDQHSLLCFYFSGNFAGKFAVAGVDLARFQRTSESAEHSTGGRGNNIVDGGCVRLGELGRIHFIVLGDGAMDAVDNGPRLARKTSDAQWALPAF